MKVKLVSMTVALVALGIAWGTVGQAWAQGVPLVIPNLEEWAASPHARDWEEPFRHWADEGIVPIPCARCHTTRGFRDYIGADGTPPGLDSGHIPSPGIQCVACHNEVTINMTSVTFPSGIEITGLGDESRCMTCHQGRESTFSVNDRLAEAGATEEDTVYDKFRFINVHYRAAGATRFGTEVKGGYEYDGKTYKGFYEHDKDYQVCMDCHETHTVQPRIAECASCHKDPELKLKRDLKKIRKTTVDYDGDGDVKEGIFGELDTMHDALLAAIQAYAKDKAGKSIIYVHSYPYFFVDKNDNGKEDRGEGIVPNRYNAFTPRLIRATYNYQYMEVDPGSYTHNPFYIMQLLYDSIADLGGDVSKFTRP